MLSPSKVKKTKNLGIHALECKKSARSADEFDEIVWVEYPNGEIFMQIDLDGDVLDPTAHRIEFSPDGKTITYSSRIPEMMLNASQILPNCPETDAFKYLLSFEVNNRKEKLKKIEPEGPFFQVRKSVELPRPMKKCFFDENYKELETYKITHSSEGCGYTFFWLLPASMSI